MNKDEFSKIKEGLLEGYNFEQAVEVVNLLKKNIKNYGCPQDISVEVFRKDVDHLLYLLGGCKQFGKETCAVSSGRFEVSYNHKEEGGYEITIHLMPLEGSYGLAADGSSGFDFE